MFDRLSQRKDLEGEKNEASETSKKATVIVYTKL